MAGYETEDQQVEALKNWWKENGRSVIAGVVIGVGVLLGWKGWTSYQEQQALTASALYSELSRAVSQQQIEQVLVQGRVLRDEYGRTAYATLATLLLAKAYNEKGEPEAALENLDWVIQNTRQDALRNLARLRKARVLIAQNQLPDAEALLQQDYPETFQSLRSELQGDLYVQQGQIESARTAYEKAIETAASDTGLDYLIMKKDNLGHTTPSNS